MPEKHTSSFLGLDQSDHSSHFWVHAGSLAPDPHRFKVSHQEESLFIPGELEQHIHELSPRPGICANRKGGGTGDRICVVNPGKTQGEQLVSQI